jgi:hypothetical protein
MNKWEKLREKLKREMEVGEGQIRANIHDEEFMDAALLKSDNETYQLVLDWMEEYDKQESSKN